MKSLLLQQMTGGRYDEFRCRDALDYSEELILGYCHLRELPDGLLHTLLDLASQLLAQGEAGGADRALSRVSVGDTSVQFFEAAGAGGLLANHLSVLNCYRRVEF